MHFTKKGCVAVPDVQKGKLRGREQHRDSPKFAQQPSGRASTRIQLPPGSQPAALPARRLHPSLGHKQHRARREGCHRETQRYQREAVTVAIHCRRDFSGSSRAPALRAVTYALAPKRNLSSVARSAGGHRRFPGRRLVSACTRKERRIGG